MKKITIYYMCSPDGDEHGEYEVWLNEKKEVIGWYDCNDANWRDEYFNSIFESIGVEIKSIKFNKKYIKNLF